MNQADSAACRGAADFPTGRRLNLTAEPDEGLMPGALFFLVESWRALLRFVMSRMPLF
jgi:hypothetical protein